jgi:hypothetical protein
MSRAPLRPSFASLAAVAFLSYAASGARGDEPAWEDPIFGREDLALTEEVVPAGWSLVEDAPAPGEKAVRAAIDAAASEAGLPKEEYEVLSKTLKSPTGTVATVSLVDVYKHPAKFRAAFAPKAEAGGFVVRELGSPARVLVVSAPADARAQVVALHVKGSAARLAKRAFEDVQGRLQEQAEILAKTSLALEPGSALPRLVFGLIRLDEAKNDARVRDKAIAEIEASLGSAATVPLDPTERAMASGYAGSLSLLKKTPEGDTKGRDHLRKAVDAPGDLSKQRVAEFRYDLACAHGRLKELDRAFAELRIVLEQDKASRIPGISHWRKDEDFTNLKSDPRWAQLLKDFGETDDTTKE